MVLSSYRSIARSFMRALNTWLFEVPSLTPSMSANLFVFEPFDVVQHERNPAAIG